MIEESKRGFFSQYRKELEQYIQDRFLLIQLQASEKLAKLIALFFILILFGFLFFFVLLFLSIMAGYYFAAITGSLYTGFGIVTGSYLCLLGILFLSRKWFNKKIINSVIGIFFEKNNEEDEKRK